jgi:hypothetical protein
METRSRSEDDKLSIEPGQLQIDLHSVNSLGCTKIDLEPFTRIAGACGPPGPNIFVHGLLWGEVVKRRGRGHRAVATAVIARYRAAFPRAHACRCAERTSQPDSAPTAGYRLQQRQGPLLATAFLQSIENQAPRRRASDGCSRPRAHRQDWRESRECVDPVRSFRRRRSLPELAASLACYPWQLHLVRGSAL